jgi:hypothetical protein
MKEIEEEKENLSAMLAQYAGEFVSSRNTKRMQTIDKHL